MAGPRSSEVAAVNGEGVLADDLVKRLEQQRDALRDRLILDRGYRARLWTSLTAVETALDRARAAATPTRAVPVGDRWEPLLERDPELAEYVPAEHRELARRTVLAPTLTLEEGPWDPPSVDSTRTYGMLMLDGLLMRRLRVDIGVAIEFLGPGDVVRPWGAYALPASVPVEAAWVTLKPSRLAVLDEQVLAAAAVWPGVSIALAVRLIRRAQNTSYLLAVSHLPRLEDRLLATLWYLASSWGQVTRSGVTVPLRLTHQRLGEIVGAQRSSVTIAMTQLQNRKALRREDNGTYLLVGSPPEWDSATDELSRGSGS